MKRKFLPIHIEGGTAFCTHEQEEEEEGGKPLRVFFCGQDSVHLLLWPTSTNRRAGDLPRAQSASIIRQGYGAAQIDMPSDGMMSAATLCWALGGRVRIFVFVFLLKAMEE